MDPQKVDRRVKYTKRLLKQSLIELMKDHPVSRISVKMLCEAADINRSTFYAHYTDQYDLLHQLEGEVIAELDAHISKDAFATHSLQTVQVMDQIYIYVAKNADLFRALISENGDSSFIRDITLLAQRKIISVGNYQNIDANTSEYLQCYAISGALSMVQKWLQDGMVESTQRMAELTSRLLYQGFSGLFFGYQGNG